MVWYQPAEIRKRGKRINMFAYWTCNMALKLLWTMFWFVLNHKPPFLVISEPWKAEIKWNKSLYYSFPLAELNWSAFHALKNSKNTVNSLCFSVTAGDCRSLMASPKGELLSRRAGQLKQNHVWTPISTGKGGRGSPASFNQDLKTGEPLIKTLLCTFILFL